jgi:hypothetical protein
VRFDILEAVEFRPEDYGADIARILTLAGGGQRSMPLVKAGTISPEACEAVNDLKSLPALVRSALYLYCGCWDAGHTTADSVDTPDGYFWHAIAHRQEPDPANAGYWFRKVGKHPIFPKLATEAAAAGYPATREWDPFAFIEFCQAGNEQIARRVQLLEWQLLFDHCARGQAG